MKNTNYEWVENKIASTTITIGNWIFILSFLSSIVAVIISVFTNIDTWIAIMVLLGGLLLSTPFYFIAMVASTRDDYTRKFIDKIEYILPKCKTLPELQELYDYFLAQTTEYNQYRLSFPTSLKNLQTIIIAKIEILEKQ